MKRVLFSLQTILILSACAQAPAFSPPPESYTTLRASVGGVDSAVTVARVDSTFFGRNLPELGRLFGPEDYAGDDAPVAIIPHAVWVEHFGERAEVIGSKLAVAGVDRTVVGVMPRGVEAPEGVFLWVPNAAALRVQERHE